MKLREMFPSASFTHKKQIPKTERVAGILATFDSPVFPYGTALPYSSGPRMTVNKWTLYQGRFGTTSEVRSDV